MWLRKEPAVYAELFGFEILITSKGVLKNVCLVWLILSSIFNADFFSVGAFLIIAIT